MAKVTNLVIKKQTDANTLFATWNFDATSKVVTKTSAAINVGSWVKIKSGAKYYNGATIPDWVMSDTWKVIQINGDRVVVNQNPSGSHAIMSAISAAYLTSTESSSSESTVVYNDTLDNYTVSWFYDSGDGVWFNGSINSTTSDAQSTYSIPSNALNVKCRVTPNSKKRKVNNQDTPYWTGEAVETVFNLMSIAPDVPSVPTITLDGYTLKAVIDNINDGRADYIEFRVYNGTTYFTGGTDGIETARASFQCTVNAGGKYRVQARALHLYGNDLLASNWSNYSSEVLAIPAAPSGITTLRGSSSTSVYLEWASVASAESYNIQYTTKLTYFDASSEVKTVSGVTGTHYEVTGLETGEQYFFRVCAVNSKGESAYCTPKSVTIGKKPSAPTTWSSTTTVVTGTPLNLYWVHNAADGSSETYAEVETTIGGVTETHTIKNDTSNEDTKDKTNVYTIATTSYKEGTSIQWRVRTAGITKEYGPWSVMRTVDVYAQPTLTFTVNNSDGDILNVVTTFPFYLKGLTGPATQAPLGYHVTITANSGYETVDNVGRNVMVNAGDVVYSRYVDTSEPLLIELSPSNINLQDATSYTVTVIASMNSGLSVTESTTFTVQWADEVYDLDAEISVDKESFVAYITPYVKYIRAAGEEETGEIPNVWLSVYRREFDGTYQLIADKVDSQANTVVTDPHPALDYARYRIIATAKDTGAVTYYDAPAIPVGCKFAIVQWDEEWSTFDVNNEDTMSTPLWSGSLLKLKWNLDVQDSVSTDSETASYIGRSYPVSYYGTQIDSSSSWSTDVVKGDTETLYALRRLAIYKGDVYVREPSGTGYWANVSVSINQTHAELVVPVSLDIKRVEGGM